MRRLICSAEYRLGQNGLSDFQVNFFFSPYEWFRNEWTWINLFVLWWHFRIILGFPASTGTISVTVQLLIYRKWAVRLTRLILMSTTRIFVALTSFRRRPIRFSAPSTFHFSVLPTPRAGKKLCPALWENRKERNSCNVTVTLFNHYRQFADGHEPATYPLKRNQWRIHLRHCNSRGHRCPTSAKWILWRRELWM